MKKIALSLAAVFFASVPALSVAADHVPIATLVEGWAKAYNKETVWVEGEVFKQLSVRSEKQFDTTTAEGFNAAIDYLNAAMGRINVRPDTLKLKILPCVVGKYVVMLRSNQTCEMMGIPPTVNLETKS